MNNKIKISNKEIKELLDTPSFEFPKYSTQIINLASQNAQATRPKVVGQMSELIHEFSGKSLEEWEEWYIKKHPDAIQKATEKIAEMIENFRNVMNQIDKELIENWVKDLVIVKTFIGLRFHEAILKKVSSIFDLNYRLANPAEEAQGIDGFIGDIPVSIKPESYKSKMVLNEDIKANLIYYKKIKGGITVDFSEISLPVNETE